MALEIVLEDALRKLRGTVGAILELRQRFGEHDVGFLDVYPRARDERTALGTSEFLMCLLLPMDAVLGSRHEQEFSIDGLLTSEETKQLILDDIKFVITEVTKDRRNPTNPPRPVFDTESPCLDGKPYAYSQGKGISATLKFAESIDAAAFYLSSFVLLKKHLKPLLATRWEGYTLLDWTDQIIKFSLRFMKSRIYDGWAFFEAGPAERPDDRSLFFFTWTASESLVTAAEAGEQAASEIQRDVLFAKTLPEVEKRLAAFPSKTPGEHQDEQQALSLLYSMTHLLIIASLLKSKASDAIEKMIATSRDYWEHLRQKLMADKEGELSNIYHFKEFSTVDIGIYPLYLRSLFLSLQNPHLSSSAVVALEQELTAAYNDLLNLYPRAPEGDTAQPELAEFAKWNLLGSNAKGGVHFIFLTERIVEAYSAVVFYLLQQQPHEESLTLQMTLQAESFRGLLSSVAAMVRQDLKKEIGQEIERQLEEFRVELLKELPTRPDRRPSPPERVALGPATPEQIGRFEELLVLTKFLVNPKLPELTPPGHAAAPAIGVVDAMRAKANSLKADGFEHSLAIRNAIREMEQFHELWDPRTIEYARKGLPGKSKKKES